MNPAKCFPDLLRTSLTGDLIITFDNFIFQACKRCCTTYLHWTENRNWTLSCTITRDTFITRVCLHFYTKLLHYLTEDVQFSLFDTVCSMTIFTKFRKYPIIFMYENRQENWKIFRCDYYHLRCFTYL